MPVSRVSLFLLTGLLAAWLNWSTLAAAEAPAANDREARAKQATAQRLAYAAAKNYNPYDTVSGDQHKAALALLDQKKYPDAIAAIQKGLEHSPYDINLLVLLASAHRESGDPAKADETRARWIALVDSILGEGDGRSHATAFRVISVHEEYAVIGVMRLKVVRQHLQAHGGSEFDVMTVQRPDSDETFDLYFNIDLPKKWLRQQFSAAKEGAVK